MNAIGFVRINGETHYLWRAVNHEGEVLEVFATKRRDRKAALEFLKRTTKRHGQAKVIVTDRLSETIGELSYALTIPSPAGRPRKDQNFPFSYVSRSWLLWLREKDHETPDHHPDKQK